MKRHISNIHTRMFKYPFKSGVSILTHQQTTKGNPLTCAVLKNLNLVISHK